MDCGVPAKDFDIHKMENFVGKLNVVLIKINSIQTKVKVKVRYFCDYNIYTFENYRYVLYKSYDLECNSNGNLEKTLLDYIK